MVRTKPGRHKSRPRMQLATLAITHSSRGVAGRTASSPRQLSPRQEITAIRGDINGILRVAYPSVDALVEPAHLCANYLKNIVKLNSTVTIDKPLVHAASKLLCKIQDMIPFYKFEAFEPRVSELKEVLDVAFRHFCRKWEDADDVFVHRSFVPDNFATHSQMKSDLARDHNKLAELHRKSLEHSKLVAYLEHSDQASVLSDFRAFILDETKRGCHPPKIQTLLP